MTFTYFFISKILFQVFGYWIAQFKQDYLLFEQRLRNGVGHSDSLFYRSTCKLLSAELFITKQEEFYFHTTLNGCVRNRSALQTLFFFVWDNDIFSLLANSSMTTSDCSSAYCKMDAISVISTAKADWFFSRQSLWPMREKIWRRTGRGNLFPCLQIIRELKKLIKLGSQEMDWIGQFAGRS